MAHHGTLTNRYAAADNNIAAKPYVVLNHDGPTYARLVIGQAIAFVTVVNAPENTVEGNHYMVANGDTTLGHDLSMTTDVDVAPQL
jgi:hypothetical protein